MAFSDESTAELKERYEELHARINIVECFGVGDLRRYWAVGRELDRRGVEPVLRETVVYLGEEPPEILGDCPDCESQNISPQGMEYAGPQAATEDVVCEDCGAVFEQVFEVTETTRKQEGAA